MPLQTSLKSERAQAGERAKRALRRVIDASRARQVRVCLLSLQSDLRERRQLILDGWKKCCSSLFNVNDPAKRSEAVLAVAKKTLDEVLVPVEDGRRR